MQVSFASIAGSGLDRINEDWVGASPTVTVVLDGVSSPPELGTGCSHGTPWYVRNLGSRILLYATTNPGTDLSECLATAIQEVANLHGDTCDLTHMGTPSATVALLREGPASWDHLVLSDAVLVLRTEKAIHVVTDDRVTQVVQDEVAAVHLETPGTKSHHVKLLELVKAQRRFRNREGGYWLASAAPQAAYYAITGFTPYDNLTHSALMTDGVSCLVDPYNHWTWDDLLRTLYDRGPCAILKEVRDVEAGDPYGRKWPRYKASDDSTIALVATTNN